MISFELTQEQKQWQEKAREFSRAVVRPLGWEMDRLPGHGEEWNTLRQEYIEKAAQKGLYALGIPQEYGGSGMDCVTMALVLEELAVGDAGLAFTTAMNATSPILFAGTEAQKEKFLPMVAGRKPVMFAFALTEPGAGSDASSLLTKAELDKNEYIINGNKRFISNGASAGLYCLFAMTGKTKGVKGISAFLVEGNRTGISGGKIEDKIGFRTSETAEVVFSDVRIPAENRLGSEGSGFKIAMQYLDGARILSAGAIAVGLVRAAYEDVVDFFNHSSESVKKNLGAQPISFTLAEIASAIEASRLLVWKAGWMLDRGISATLNAAWSKFFATDQCIEAINKAVQLLGLHGYGKEHPLEKYLRDAKVLQIYEGTNEICRLVASRFIK
jgi:alkylation response protein AidB-like acyl-CoA dehydrogenase